jgi:hypothetical protein
MAGGYDRPAAGAQARAKSELGPHGTSTAAGEDRLGPRTDVDDASTPGSGRVEPSKPSGSRAPGPGAEPALPSIERLEPPLDEMQRPLPADEPEPPAYELLDRWAGAVWSRYATTCYLLNLLLRFDEEPGWADLLRFGRRVLRGEPGARRRARDPLWRLLRDLSGAARLPARPVPPWWQPALAYLSEHRLAAPIFAQPGRITVTRTHVDVILDLEQIDLAVRISGLDQNPEWVRSLGRIVNFHFEDAHRSPQ